MDIGSYRRIDLFSAAAIEPAFLLIIGDPFKPAQNFIFCFFVFFVFCLPVEHVKQSVRVDVMFCGEYFRKTWFLGVIIYMLVAGYHTITFRPQRDTSVI